MKRSMVLFALAVTLIAACGTGKAADLLGLYIGGAMGGSTVRVDKSLTGTSNDVTDRHTGWKAMVGIRPLSIVGAELEYLDFGNPSYTSGPATGVVDSKAVALLGVLYAPIPIPVFDLYGKLGVARLQTDVNGQILGLFCPVGFPNCGTIAASHRDTGVGYGGGMQFKFAAVAVRAEYERVESSNSSPDMFSLGLTWTF
jgi:opacity protein-like surface antigen